MRELKIEQAQKGDLPRILEIYGIARSFMRKTGNKNQWINGFPPKTLLEADIEARQLYVVKAEETIHGVFAFILGEDPTYLKIERGQWLSDTEYGTLHRVAGSGEIGGIFSAIVSFCEGKIRHLRVDTHEDNKVMQHVILKNGFRECGIIHIADGSPRIAYEKV